MNKTTDLPPPPQAEQREHSFSHHGMMVEDPWAWIRDQGYPSVTDENVLAYLKAENAYFEAWKAPHEQLLEELFEEMKGRIKEDESSVPIRDGDWLYWWKFKPGAQYRSWYRKRFAGGEDELIFDEPAEAEGKD
jgi:oligopeptidase B